MWEGKLLEEMEENRFKFQSFNQRIATIKIDVAHRISETHETPEDEQETFFQETLTKWIDLNCTQDFTKFYHEVKGYVQNLKQLLYHKDEVLRILCKHIQSENSKCLDALLDLLAQFTRDLQHEAYQYFEEIYTALTKVLRSRDPEIIENAFVCLAYIFKYLWRYMLEDSQKVYGYYKSLLRSSQKPYIQQFAAESIAFLVRKFKNKDVFLDMIFQSVCDDPSLTEGVGLMLFETIKGVNKMFNSQAANVLQMALSKLSKESIPGSSCSSSEVFQCISVTVLATCKYISKEYFDLLWKELIFQTEMAIRRLESSVTEEGNISSEQRLFHLLELVTLVVEWKSGVLVGTFAKKILELLNQLLGMDCPVICQDTVIRLFTKVIHCSGVTLPDKDVQQTMTLLFTKKFDANKISYLMKDCRAGGKFETMSVSLFLLYVGKGLIDIDVSKEEVESLIFFLAEHIATKKDHFTDVFSSQYYENELLHFPNNDAVSVSDVLLDKISAFYREHKAVFDAPENELDLLWSCLVCLPYVRPLSVERALESLHSLAMLLSTAVMEKHGRSHRVLFLISQAIRSFYMIKSAQKSKCDVAFEYEDLCCLLRLYPSNVHLLQAFEIFSDNMKDQNDELAVRLFQEVFDLLKHNLSSNLAILRKLTLLIFLHLSNSLESPVMLSHQSIVLKQCLDVENIAAAFASYLERLLHLRKLVYKSSESKEARLFNNELIVRYLVGNLRINLRPMWQPIMDVIRTHSVDENQKDFWTVFKELLAFAFDNNDEEDMEVADSGKIGSGIIEKYRPLASETDALSRSDRNNLCLLLCQTMEEFPLIVEARSRDVVPLFLTFLSKEYGRFDDSFRPSQDLSSTNNQEMLGRADEEVEGQDEQLKSTEHIEQGEAKRRVGRKQESGKKLKTLAALLKLFGHFKNPRALFKEPQMYKAYLQLLMHRENEIQQHVYNCLKTYKFPFLKPYEEQFDKLLQDNTFKDALTLFAAGDEVEMVKKDHRNDVINFLIRLLYGKLQRRSGLGVSGKSSQSARRNIIINFISCCPEEELVTFVNLITEPFKDSKKDSIHEVIPLRKQIGFLHMLHTILTRLSGLIVPHVDHLLKTLLDILERCQMCLERRNQINSTFIGQLKSIRQLSISRITEFFEILPDFDFLPYVDMIFINAVMPQVSRLHQESQQHPSPLLKLLYHWSTSPKYYEWLNKDLRCYHIKAPSLQTAEAGPLRETTVVPVSNDLQIETPLRFILKILGVKDKSETVVKMLMKMVQSIFQMKVNDDSDDAMEGVERGDNALRSSALKMIDGHVGSLLNHLFEAVKRKTGAQLSKIKVKDETFQAELSVLALISSFVTDPSQCQTVVSILFPTLKWIKHETDQVNTLVTLKNLVKHCGNTRQIAVETMNLFMSLKERKARTILCELFQVVFDSPEISCIIRDMNSWDKKFVDEPDFEQRFQAFSRATSMLKAGDLSSKQIKPVLANCLYFSLEVQDMSLRDVSISFIIHMIDFIKASGSRIVVDDLLTGLLLPVVRKAVRSKNEIVRGEYTKILSRVVKHIDESSVSDMRILTNEDPEVDFFENVRHIQMHRRIRAVRQLAQLSKEGRLKQNSLYAFLLPLVSHFIFDNVASKDHNLVTATIEAIGAILHTLPWQRYSHVLRNYLRLLPKEKAKKKIIIRVVVAVLDAFHFDMTMLSDDDIKPEKMNQKKLTKGIEELNNEATRSEKENAVEDEGNEDEDEADMADNDDQDCKESESTVTSAMKIHKTIQTTILPQLHKSLVKKSFVEDFHRKSRNKEIDDDAVLRVPIALAIIKLLQKLPKSTLHEQLPGVLLRVCQTLKSRAREVRETARETLVHITSSLGPEYFPYVLKEMKSTLQRGYQLHVLAFTLKSIFDALFDQLKPGDLDQCLASIIEVMMQDVFGNIAEEKEVEGITGKLHEAKTTKSYDSFEIVSQFVSPASLGNLLKSVRELLVTSHTHKVSNKAKEVLRRIGVGLQKNSSLSLTDLLVFIHQTLSGLQPVIMESNSKELRKGKEEEEFRRQDIYLVKKEPGRGQKIVEHDKRANLHLLGEFCLQLLHSFLKNQKLMPSNQEHIRMLDPYVPVLIECLKSKYNRIIILAAKSMALLIRFPLPSLQTNTKTLATLLFKLLKNYARIGAGMGDNYELVLSAFKAMTVIIRDNKNYKVTEEQLKILLAFVEEDVYDYTRQATAFPLLKAILSRKLNAKEIVDVMKKVAELSVTSESDSVQLQCRQLMLQYLLDYPLGKNIEKHLQFFVSNLGYAIESGRRSALEMMAVLIKNFPEERINEYSSYFYLPLAMRLVNDESALCRKLSNAVLKTLLQRINAEKRTELLELTLKWLQQEKVSVQRLAMQIIGIFAEVEGAAFEKRLSAILPSINSAIKPSLYTAPDDYDDQSQEMKSKDQFLFNTLTALMKIFQNCDVIRKISFQESLTEIWGSIQAHLQYPHTWVRLVSSQLFGFLFASWPPSELVAFSREGTASQFYITDHLPSKLKLLCKDFCDQLKSENLNQEFGEQITKNVIYLIKLINLSGQNSKVENGADENSVEDQGAKGDGGASTLPTLRWLLNKLSNLASFEASQEQKAQIKRMCVFRCLAAVSIDLAKDGIHPYISEILKPLHRELVSSSSESELYKLALEVVELIKEVVGKEVFAEIYAKVQRKVSEKKEFRKRKNAEEAVVDPEKFAKKKQKKNLQKRDQRKRKLVEKKPSLLKGSKRTKNQPI